jgi:hypothetical protein
MTRKGGDTVVHDEGLWGASRKVDPDQLARDRARWQQKLDDNARRRPDPGTARP